MPRHNRQRPDRVATPDDDDDDNVNDAMSVAHTAVLHCGMLNTVRCYIALLPMSWRLDVMLLLRCILAPRSTSLILSGSQCCRLKVLRYRSWNCWMISTVRSTTPYHITTSTRSVTRTCDISVLTRFRFLDCDQSNLYSSHIFLVYSYSSMTRCRDMPYEIFQNGPLLPTRPPS